MLQHNVEISQALTALLDHVTDRLADRIIARLDEGFEQEPPPALLDSAGLARKLGISVPTVAKLRNAGLPTVWVTPNAPRFELDRAVAFLRTKGQKK